VLLEFHVPTELKVRDDGSTKFMWPGFPHLWKPMEHTWEGQPSLWYALRQPLDPKFLKHVHGVGSSSRSPVRPTSRGFLVVATRTGAILSPLFKKRAEAHEALQAILAAEGTPMKVRSDDVAYRGDLWARSMGVHQVKLYPNETYNPETYRP
jgi:hypothetical protein